MSWIRILNKAGLTSFPSDLTEENELEFTRLHSPVLQFLNDVGLIVVRSEILPSNPQLRRLHRSLFIVGSVTLCALLIYVRLNEISQRGHPVAGLAAKSATYPPPAARTPAAATEPTKTGRGAQSAAAQDKPQAKFFRREEQRSNTAKLVSPQVEQQPAATLTNTAPPVKVPRRTATITVPPVEMPRGITATLTARPVEMPRGMTAAITAPPVGMPRGITATITAPPIEMPKLTESLTASAPEKPDCDSAKPGTYQIELCIWSKTLIEKESFTGALKVVSDAIANHELAVYAALEHESAITFLITSAGSLVPNSISIEPSTGASEEDEILKKALSDKEFPSMTVGDGTADRRGRISLKRLR
jgi:hypothetical protein